MPPTFASAHLLIAVIVSIVDGTSLSQCLFVFFLLFLLLCDLPLLHWHEQKLITHPPSPLPLRLLSALRPRPRTYLAPPSRIVRVDELGALGVASEQQQQRAHEPDSEFAVDSEGDPDFSQRTRTLACSTVCTSVGLI
jgi:hypothetical protein